MVLIKKEFVENHHPKTDIPKTLSRNVSFHTKTQSRIQTRIQMASEQLKIAKKSLALLEKLVESVESFDQTLKDFIAGGGKAKKPRPKKDKNAPKTANSFVEYKADGRSRAVMADLVLMYGSGKDHTGKGDKKTLVKLLAKYAKYITYSDKNSKTTFASATANSGRASKILGAMWALETKETKDKYVAMAKATNEERKVASDDEASKKKAGKGKKKPAPEPEPEDEPESEAEEDELEPEAEDEEGESEAEDEPESPPKKAKKPEGKGSKRKPAPAPAPAADDDATQEVDDGDDEVVAEAPAKPAKKPTKKPAKVEVEDDEDDVSFDDIDELTK